VNVLVTGCQGFVGHAACAAFHVAGHQVTGVDLRPGQQEPWRTFQARADHAGFVDILRASNASVLVHAAGTASVAESFQEPAKDFDGSVLLLRNVLEAARRTADRPVVLYISSAAVYGQPELIPTPEDAPKNPVSPYGHHKLMCEQLAQSYFLAGEVRSVGLRVFSLIGPRQRRLLPYELASQALSGRAELVIEGTGNETRDYLDVEDLGRLLVALSGIPVANGATVLNCASGVETSVGVLANLVLRATHSTSKVVTRNNPRPGNPSRWCADVTRLRQWLPGFHAKSVAQALEHAVSAWAKP